MKKWLWIGLCLLLCGCGSTVYETLGDEYTPGEPAPQAVVVLKLSQEIAVETIQSQESDSLYFCNGFTLARQTLSSGDLDRTLREVTGYARENLSVVERTQQGIRRYDFVWSCAGEGGIQLCRGSILDDGSYHYVVTTMACEERAGELLPVWNEIFASFSLNTDQDSADTAP